MTAQKAAVLLLLRRQQAAVQSSDYLLLQAQSHHALVKRQLAGTGHSRMVDTHMLQARALSSSNQTQQQQEEACHNTLQVLEWEQQQHSAGPCRGRCLHQGAAQ